MQWEYRIVSNVDGEWGWQINDLGREGWELTAIYERGWVFKRPLPDHSHERRGPVPLKSSVEDEG